MRTIVVLGLFLFSMQAHAWGEIGHGATGKIAEERLTPKGKAFVHRILGIEPLAVAAVWPDQVRSDARFNSFSPYHFIEVPPGLSVEKLGARRAEFDAHSIIERVPELLVQEGLSREQKMILFRYYVHVVGDVHQPVHVGNGLDRGANLCDVRWINPESGQEQVVNLHAVWDDHLIRGIGVEYRKSLGANGPRAWFGYKEFAEIVMRDNQINEKELIQLSSVNPLTWYREAQALHSVVYPDGKSGAKPDKRSYCKLVDPKTKQVVDGAFDKNRPLPLLDEAYLKKAVPVIQKQILLAGVRLAHQINRMAETLSIRERTLKDDEQDLKEILIRNASSKK